jgi:hypothetical protein
MAKYLGSVLVAIRTHAADGVLEHGSLKRKKMSKRRKRVYTSACEQTCKPHSVGHSVGRDVHMKLTQGMVAGHWSRAGRTRPAHI